MDINLQLLRTFRESKRITVHDQNVAAESFTAHTERSAQLNAASGLGWRRPAWTRKRIDRATVGRPTRWEQGGLISRSGVGADASLFAPCAGRHPRLDAPAGRRTVSDFTAENAGRPSGLQATETDRR